MAAGSAAPHRPGKLERVIRPRKCPARHLEKGLGPGGIGSNAWAVAGKHTGGRGAPLSNDPHLNLQLPSAWYVVIAKGATQNVQGMSMVGLPVVVFSHNAHIAWEGRT